MPSQAIGTKVVGVTFEGRQKKLADFYAATVKNVTIERDHDNAYDENAVKVVGHGDGKDYDLGFIGRDISSHLAPIMDNGGTIGSVTFNVHPGDEDYNWGMDVNFILSQEIS